MASRAMKTFNKLKDQGLTDDEAMRKAFGLAVKGRAKLRAADKKAAKRETLRRKVRHAVTGKTDIKSHSPAGRVELRRRKAGVK